MGKAALGAILLLFTTAVNGALAQNAGSPQCQPVEARTKAEAQQMERSADHKGCWTRQVDGTLIFVSSEDPTRYKTVLPRNSGTDCRPQLFGATSRSSNANGGDLSGVWRVKSGVYPGEAELRLIDFGQRLHAGERPQILNGCRAVDLDTETLSFVREGMKYCLPDDSSTPCVRETTPGVFAGEQNGQRCRFEIEVNTLKGYCAGGLLPDRVVLFEGTRADAATDQPRNNDTMQRPKAPSSPIAPNAMAQDGSRARNGDSREGGTQTASTMNAERPTPVSHAVRPLQG